MKSQLEAPEFQKDAFDCPRCGAFAHMRWNNLLLNSSEYSVVWTACCAKCKKDAVWVVEDSIMRRLAKEEPGPVLQVFPTESAAPLPSPDLPVDCEADFREAREIVRRSPRGAAALLRLVIQKLCRHFGEPGRDINSDIGELVKKGLPAVLQKALDTVRVIGNEAVHPGEMDIRDNHEVALSLFVLINLIVDRMITEPAKLEALYQSLPAKKLAGIAQRDK
ncbi:DUF4145 domain-containing protein [Pandoraea communis]|uniref:DUF4145 domain-containing protein n=1 Tax=Pandoraea communis TaxID=2508297 RepID=UPI0025A5E269|nr:DUF4145 domain-containing protein [Pandoraea communis]MDM8359022.1 DUF4145 domain-containing protein [Pandoraea communis]